MSHAEDHEGTRRDFLYYATAGAGAITAGAAVWPLVNQMNPSADVKALSSIRVDISEIEPGTQLTVKWLGKPVFIRRRTEDEISEARGVAMDDLIDLSARNNNAPELDAADENRALDETGRMVGDDGRVHASGLCAFGRWRWRFPQAGSAPAMDRITIHLVAFAKAQLRRICRCPWPLLSTILQSNWVKELL